MRQCLSYTVTMAATYETRIARLKRLEALLPRGRTDGACPDGTRLLEILGEVYVADTESARRRTLQRDLEVPHTTSLTSINANGAAAALDDLGIAQLDPEIDGGSPTSTYIDGNDLDGGAP